MSRFREIKRKARRDLHQEMAVPALYRVTPNDEWEELTVRIHHHFARIGDGEGLETMRRQDVGSRLIFLRSDLPESTGIPTRGAQVSVGEGEAYTVQPAAEPDDEFVTAFVSTLSAAACAGFPVPSEPC